MQRRRGLLVTVWKTGVTVDKRGNKTLAADPDHALTVRAYFIPQRSSKAEVSGQQQINVVRMLVAADVPGLDLWSRVEWNGKQWDVVSPPAYHHGSARTRHWSLDIRERP
jgi:hypothetical protein